MFISKMTRVTIYHLDSKSNGTQRIVIGGRDNEKVQLVFRGDQKECLLILEQALAVLRSAPHLPLDKESDIEQM